MTAETDTLAEAGRLMTVCNSCRYCEGLCAVFPAMELRRDFAAGDLRYLANLCHGCGACYDDCQFAPPHEFAVNVPRTLSRLRAQSYAHYAWPPQFAGLFARNGLKIAVLTAVCAAGFFAGFGSEALFVADSGAAFYRLMPHNAMVLLFGAAALYALVALVMGFRMFLRDGGEVEVNGGSLAQALKDAMSLRYLDGGGVGCASEGDRAPDRRRLFHHFTFYGFGLCFASTSIATVYHYGFGWQAPYGWFDLPVLLGTAGGIGLLIGTAGLLHAKRNRDPALADASTGSMDTAFVVMLFLTSLTGLALLALRETAAMGTLLAVHLGVVLSLFLTLPYGKFVHGLYRFAALLRYAREMR